MNDRRTIELDHGWEFMQRGITKLKRILEGLPEPQFSSEDYMMLYTTIYNMSTQKPPHDYSQQLYDRYREAFQEYISSTEKSKYEERYHEASRLCRSTESGLESMVITKYHVCDSIRPNLRPMIWAPTSWLTTARKSSTNCIEKT